MTAILTTLVSFAESGGHGPLGGLMADANGDLFGTTAGGPFGGTGTVFEIERTSNGYAASPTTLATFSSPNGEGPAAGLIADANGDLFGTTTYGGLFGDGTVFEITKTAAGYASTPTTLVSFNQTDGQYPEAALIADANGDLFGTTKYGGTYANGGVGTVFEIKKTAAGYASAPTTLVSFDATDGAHPFSSLIADANGDLFGTTEAGLSFSGTAFEITKTAAGYASTPTTLVTFFNLTDGANPYGGLVADADGDLFGTTANYGGSPSGYGTVFEIKKTGAGYASAPTTLVVFDGLDGAEPQASLIVDANGDLFGTTAPNLQEGLPGGSPDGTVFEIKRTATGYASAPTTLFTFNVADETNGLLPVAGLIADSNGDLFGTTEAGGANLLGTVFEITDSGFVNKGSSPPPATSSNILWRNASTGGVELWSPNGSGGFTYENLGAVSTSWQIQGTGDFTGSGEDGILWQNTSTSALELWNPNGSGGFTYESLGAVNSSWKVQGTGDFTGAGADGVLWRNSSTGGVELWNSNGSGDFSYDNLGVVNSAWQIQGTGDFTGGGEDGIVWRNSSTGAVELWNPNGSGGFAYDNLGAVNSKWQIQETGDFTGNGSDDILWRNSTNGDTELWNSNGSGGFTYKDLGVVSTSWQIQDAGDFTGSGADSILWRNASSGAVELWNPNGSGGFTYNNLGAVSPSWQIFKQS
jgi:hypothetical protein